MSQYTSVDTRALRDALGNYATGIAVVTTLDTNGEWVGMTVNSFASVSLEPPLILWSIALDSPSMPAFTLAKHYAVNVLSAEQSEMSQRFATRQADKFAGLEVEVGLGGVPLLPGCIARFECSAAATHEGGDHRILIGRVERFASVENAAPLIFHGGRYRALA